jgi:sigma-B regulation protein RsbU (phosphoserine phosphatase)
MIRAVIHTYPGMPDDPPSVLRYINSHFEYLWDTPMYATAIYAVCDTANRTMRVSSAGHPPPLIARPDGQVHTSKVDTTLCLLWNELTDIPCAEHPLTPGDRWAFFTDGVTDRQSPDGTMFDLERLSAALGRQGRETPQDIVTAIVSELDEFSGGVEPEDDQTLLIVGYD